ncbi:MAG: phosphomannose isomerase type II C-terminal cupin domain [Rhodospirillales bacterium]|nr:phosphomannose isomerase type II C-terminal cupin domain [Rhodospirillales bacterium]
MAATGRGYTIGESDQRPWGEWHVLDVGAGYAVKRIRVRPGGVLSLQRHQHRAEDWTIVAGQARVTLGIRVFDVPSGGAVHINVGDTHRISNPGSEDVVFIEVQTGAVLSESDIERLEDRYGRS